MSAGRRRVIFMDSRCRVCYDVLAHSIEREYDERTLLSYVRTGLGCFAVGIPAVWWLDGAVIQTLGVVSLVMGAVFLGVGVRRCLTIQAGIDRQPD